MTPAMSSAERLPASVLPWPRRFGPPWSNWFVWEFWGKPWIQWLIIINPAWKWWFLDDFGWFWGIPHFRINSFWNFGMQTGYKHHWPICWTYWGDVKEQICAYFLFSRRERTWMLRNFHQDVLDFMVPSGKQTRLAGKSSLNGGFNGKIIL